MVSLPAWYRTPMTQVVLVGIVCFATVGMFSAVSNLGAGGLSDVALSDTANGVLYGCFTLTGFVAGGINNVLGPRLTLFLGSLGYALYVGALWCYQTQKSAWFLIFAGAILGISAALLWAAQGAIMMSYPLKGIRARPSFGALIGSVIALAINLRQGGLSAVSTSTYIAFLAIIFLGVACTWLLLPPNMIVRGDGSVVQVQSASNPKQEVTNFLNLLKDWRMLALLPMSFASNYFYAYQGAVNAFYFDSTTRALNATLEGAGAIVGALFVGFFVLDGSLLKITRRTRGILGLTFVAMIVIAVWSCSLAWQITFTRKSHHIRMNYKDSGYASKAALFFFYYFGDASYQALAYWIMGAISNDPFTLARFAGFYKAIQSAGGAGSFGMDAVATPFLNEHLASWLLMLAGFPGALAVIRAVKETTYDVEGVVYADDLNKDPVVANGVESPSLEKV
ncbi:MFS general substrate transporter [Cantharellus anzutake]|uniref:MFS general substrate transporter n=1 Tax=Cantharellus anzutake TaxID=1750568 RepID=UPI0019089202|nr:MFS general substrate transporter [Cantharellus anzutake]KAF8335875.1 MFS general substrate transporter [Cantharellus anzutake]